MANKISKLPRVAGAETKSAAVAGKQGSCSPRYAHFRYVRADTLSAPTSSSSCRGRTCTCTVQKVARAGCLSQWA